jgi:hypothetical protein
MAENDAERTAREKREADLADRQDRAPLTGARNVMDVLRHLVTHGPARNDAERAELTGVLDASDPDFVAPEHVMTDAEKAAEYDRFVAEQQATAKQAAQAPEGGTQA